MIVNNWYVFLISKIGGTVLTNMTESVPVCKFGYLWLYFFSIIAIA